MISSLRLILAAVFLLLLSACGSAPSISESTVLDRGAAKVRAIQFVYRKGEMRQVSSTSSGRGGVTIGNTGFEEFGPLLVQQAGPALSAHDLKVVSAAVHDGKGPIIAQAPADAPLPHLLILGPEKAQISATSAVTRMNYVFSVALIDPQARKRIWQAKIDTSTWVGTDFVTRNMDGRKFDATYATELLNAIVRQMKTDGVI